MLVVLFFFFFLRAFKYLITAHQQHPEFGFNIQMETLLEIAIIPSTKSTVYCTFSNPSGFYLQKLCPVVSCLGIDEI